MKEKEVYSALKMYNEKAMETTRERLQDWQGGEDKPKTNRHYGKQVFKRKKSEEDRRKGLKNTNLEVRGWAVRDAMYPDGEWRNKNGRPLAKQAIMDFVKEEYLKNGEFPKKSEVIRATGISKPTVYKYYDDAIREVERVPTLEDLLQESLDRDAQNWLRQCREEKANENPKTDS